MPTRRLAAVLFADIVGYTAMMQQNETEGMAKAQTFRNEVPQLVQDHQGEVIEIKGDGALCLFNSAAEATACAQEIQVELGADIPLRIGIHLGDVMQHSDHIMGDAVNIASRIESMGVAGAVLLSSSIRQQIKNKPEFELVSLGKFAFKNVAEPMTVYALGNAGMVLPKAEQMKGKGDQVDLSSKRIVQLASVGFVAMALGAMIFWVGGFMGANEDQLSARIKEERVAIIPFNNRTTNSELNVFGDFCSDIITNGLTEAGIKTCSPRTIQQYNHLIGVLPNNPEGQASFSEVVGARYWVEGYFSQKADTITVNSYLTDGINGDIVRNFPEVKGHFEDKEGLVGELSRRLMGYWVARDVIDRGKFKTPKYEAFREYQKLFTENDWDGDYSLRAFAMDTTFYLAALEKMFWLADNRNQKYDSVLNLLAPHYNQMTQYEQVRFDANRALYERDYPNYVKNNEILFQMFPQDLSQTAHYGFHLDMRENMPSKAWKVSNEVDWYNISEDLHPFRNSRMWFISCHGIGAEKYQETIQLLDDFSQNDAYNFIFKSIIYARTQQLDSLYSLADKLSTYPKLTAPLSFTQEYDLVDFCNDAAEEFLLQGNDQEAKKILRMALEWIEENQERLSTQFDSLDLARTYRLMGEPEKSLPLGEISIDLYRRNRQKSWKYKSWYYHRYMSDLAVDYVYLGKEDKAKELIETFQDGWGPQYFKARVYAVLGEKEKAMELCREWRAGWGWSHGSYLFYKHDYFMQNMNGYPPYEEFVRIRD